MISAEEKLFPYGVPATLSYADFGRLLGVSSTKAAAIAKERPEMLVALPGMTSKRVKSELYFEIVGAEKR